MYIRKTSKRQHAKQIKQAHNKHNKQANKTRQSKSKQNKAKWTNQNTTKQNKTQQSKTNTTKQTSHELTRVVAFLPSELGTSQSRQAAEGGFDLFLWALLLVAVGGSMTMFLGFWERRGCRKYWYLWLAQLDPSHRIHVWSIYLH